jgi:hypothetical protein
VRKLCLRIFPYLSCALFIEIFSLMLAIFIIYGKWIGVPIGFILSFALCTAVVGAYFRSSSARLALLLAYDLHVAVTISMIIRLAVGLAAGVPVWVLVSRIVILPWEISAVMLLPGSAGSEE